MNSNPTDHNDDQRVLKEYFNKFVSEREHAWLGAAKHVTGANEQDAENGYQVALAKLWKKIWHAALPGDAEIEDVLLRALKPKDPQEKPNPNGWMNKVISDAVTDEVRKMYKIPRRNVKDGDATAPQARTEKEQDENLRRRSVQMTEDHLANLAATQPDSSHEWSEAQSSFIENARKWLDEAELIAIDAKLRLDPPDVTWAILAAEVGGSELALKKRASRATRKLRAKLAYLGYTNLGSI